MRTRGEGTVYFDKSRPEGFQYVAENYVDGRRIRTLGKSNLDAKTKMKAKLKALEAGNVPASKMTVGELLDKYVTSAVPNRTGKGRSITTGTIARHEWAAERLKGALVKGVLFETIPLTKLTAFHVDDALDYLAIPQKPKKGKKSTPSALGLESLRRVRNTLSLALDWALKRNLVGSNVAKSAEMPTTARLPKGKKALTFEQAQRLADVLQQSDEGVVFYLMLGFGLRWQEAAGLAVDAVCADGTVKVWRTIRRDVVKVKTGDDSARKGQLVLVEGTKTSKSVRTLRLSPEAVAVLAGHMERNTERRRLALERHGVELLFTDKHGGLLDPANSRRLLRRFSQQADVFFDEGNGKRRAPTPHELRHTAGDLYLRAKAPPMAVSDLLGHTDERMLRRTYRHLTVVDARTAAADFWWLTSAS
jgi:integrase